MRAIVIAGLLIGCDHGDAWSPKQPEPTPPGPQPIDPAKLAADACPPEDLYEDIVRSAVWPRCPIDPPFTEAAARCANGRGCMRPCRREGRTAGKPVDFAIDFQYDAAGHLTRSKDSMDVTRTCDFDGDRVRRCESSTGSEERFEYVGDRVARIRHLQLDKDVGLQTFEYSGDGRLARATVKFDDDPLQHQTYSYDARGRLVRIGARTPGGRIRDELVTTLSYDAGGRLTGIREEWIDDQGKVTDQSAYGTRTWTYDAKGRIVESTRGLTTDDMNRSRFTYGYDASGRLVSVRRGHDGFTTTYRYDCK